ncbi:MAG: DUF3426 domain-containing protein [Rhodospirillales bacterium]|nr:DUF3426 domain-containing protein [Rhodospirillales bacterium]
MPPARPASAVYNFEDTEDEAATGDNVARLDPVDEEPASASSPGDRRTLEKRDRASGNDDAPSPAAAPPTPTLATLAASATTSGGTLRKRHLAKGLEYDPASTPRPAGAAAGDASIPPPPVGDDAIRPQPSSRAHDRSLRMAVVAIGAVAATVLVSVGLLAATRDAVIAAFPGAAGVYSAVGLAASDAFAEGLEIRSVSSSRSWNDGGQVLTVAGDLANTAQKPRALPMVRVVLVDKSNAEVQEVVVRPPGETLPVGKSVRFEAQITDPAESAERIKVSLAPRPAAS